MTKPYGTDDASFQAAGGRAGIFKLVQEFFARLGARSRFRTIWDMHPATRTCQRTSSLDSCVAGFGGPKLFREKYGSIQHTPRPLTPAYCTTERDLWLTCMSETVAEQLFADDFKVYLMEQLFVPAEGVRRRCEATGKQA